MAVYIIKIFLRSRNLFGTFNTDKWCRVCGKIGHFVKDCPSSRKNMKKLARDPDHINLMNSAKCFVCQEPGHFAKNCPEKFNRKKNDKFEKNSNPRDEKDNGKPLVMMQDNRKRYQNRKEKSERNRKKTENGDVGEKDSKDESYLNYKNKTNRGYNRGRYKRDNNDKEREHFEKLTQNFIRGGKP